MRRSSHGRGADRLGVVAEPNVTIRPYLPADEQGWLRCRALAFLSTAYFDDVLTTKPRCDTTAVELVAEEAGAVIGLIDVAVEAELATIETVAVHPDAPRRGIGSRLLDEASQRLPRGSRRSTRGPGTTRPPMVGTSPTASRSGTATSTSTHEVGARPRRPSSKR